MSRPTAEQMEKALVLRLGKLRPEALARAVVWRCPNQGAHVLAHRIETPHGSWLYSRVLPTGSGWLSFWLDEAEDWMMTGAYCSCGQSNVDVSSPESRATF